MKGSSYSDTLSEKDIVMSSSESYVPCGAKRLKADDKPQDSLIELECQHSEIQSKEI
jgi:hypothetical protein